MKRMGSRTPKGTTIALCTLCSQAEHLIHQIIVLDLVPFFRASRFSLSAKTMSSFFPKDAVKQATKQTRCTCGP